ncbi:methoxyneurosporene dehydrogenase [Tabrizicola sp. TH137]|uniref:1-hydroxycarotenoid 3,4-desaturase CrtD n=1 Tax=Tabrizicola sp. TH137 TaxID=2067452 RepID=UPI000C7C23F6|nr:1-hydroxycarotenoid 3,4-desaturase CrtD [Tabrizicola sp. TH137]PLL12407.1 methoxyneurosporene dehydrogenase [Tabrizicola sp. TH137]
MEQDRIIVIGAGMGGLAAAIRLAASGLKVTVLEAAATPGGKARAIPSPAGPVDTGPTVLTLRSVFDTLFALNGERLDDHLTLIPQPLLARHWWPGSDALDLTTDREANAEAIQAFAGPREADAFLKFDALAEDLFTAFDAPVMQAARPDLPAIARAALARPRLWPALLPGLSLERWLKGHFRDPRLVQLFARYATYVGGRPGRSPAVLSLIWRAEARGVWAVEGGMHHLAAALAALAERMGVTVRYATPATRIQRQNGRVTGVQIADGHTLPCRAVVFNGDPAALADGHLGPAAAAALPRSATQPRSLSALVWAFASQATGPRAPDLIHHNLFFTEDPAAEFGPIGQGRMPAAPTLYLCAEDRARGPAAGPERFEIILNAPAGLPALRPEDFQTCRQITFDRLSRMGLTLTPPGPEALTSPAVLDRLFPASKGAIYGRSPEGTMASFQRPPARTALPGLYLAGGGAHPGAGVPMAALSAKHAVEAIMQDRTSASRSAPTAMPGGISTGSRMTGGARSRS